MKDNVYGNISGKWHVIRKLILVFPENICQVLYSDCEEEYSVWNYEMLCQQIEHTDHVHQIDQNLFRENINAGYICKRLQAQEKYEFQYRAAHGQGVDWYTVRISVQEWTGKRPRVAVMETVRQPILFWNTAENLDKLSELARICFRGFALAYYNIILADINQNSYLVQNPFGDDVFRKMEICPAGNYAEDNRGYAVNFIHPEDRDLFLEHTTLEGYRKYVPQPRQHDTFRLRHVLNGEYRWVAIHAVHMPHTGNDFLVLYWVEDIHQRVLHEQKNIDRLNEAIWQAHQANQAKTDFLSRITHDLRTPLNGILGMLDIAEERKDDPDALADCSRKIRGSAEYLLSLIADLLDVAKLEQGKMTFRKEYFDIGAHFEECRDILQPVAMSKGITLSMDLLENPGVVSGCPKQMRQILVNLVSNAVKYNKPDGSVTVSAEVVSRQENTLEMRYLVTDTGIGMSREFMEVMFEPFKRDASVEKRDIEGVGLGLPIVFQLVQKLGGTLEVKSQLGIGSSFIVTMPFQWTDQKEEHTLKSESVETFPDLQGKRVMVVDDQEINREILGFVLGKYQLQIDMAQNGLEAVKLFEDSAIGTYDMIFMDLHMPVMHGENAAEAIRGMTRRDAESVPIIAMSAGDMEQEGADAVHAAITDVLPKPVDPKMLVMIFEKYWGQNAI